MIGLLYVKLSKKFADKCICSSQKNEFFVTFRIFGETRCDRQKGHRAKNKNL